MRDNETVIRRFIADWSSLDPDLLVAFSPRTASITNMPMKPVAERAALRAFVARFLRDRQRTDWETVNLLSRGDLRMAERIRSHSSGRAASRAALCGCVRDAQGADRGPA